MAKIEQLELTVQDKAIHCGGCESRIQNVLGKLPGVIKAKADHQTQQVSLALDTDKTTVDEVKEKLAAAGYRAA
jgi:copper chaperone CopZ